MILTQGSHAPIACAALDRGLGVFAEKPLAFSSQEAAEVVAAVERTEGCLVVGYMKRYDPAYERMAELVSTLDDLRLMRVTTLEAAIANMAVHGRIVLCGLVSSYDSERQRPPGNMFHLIARRVRMEGYLLSDYGGRMPEATACLRAWEAAGELAHREDIAEGFEQAPAAFLRLFSGANQGKQLLRL